MTTPNSTPVPDDRALLLMVTETVRGHIDAEMYYCVDCARDVNRDAEAAVAEGRMRVVISRPGETYYSAGRYRVVHHRWIEVPAHTAGCYGSDACPIAVRI